MCAIHGQPTAIAMCMNGLGVQRAASGGILLARAHLEVTPTTLIISLRAESGRPKSRIYSVPLQVQCPVDN